MPRCVLVFVSAYVSVCIRGSDISLALSAPLKIRWRAKQMKRDKVQNKDESRNKSRVASMHFRARTMSGLSPTLCPILSLPLWFYLVSNSYSSYIHLHIQKYKRA